MLKIFRLLFNKSEESKSSSRFVVQAWGKQDKAGAGQDIIPMVKKHIISNHRHQKGHVVAMHVLDHLRSAVVCCADKSLTCIWVKFFIVCWIRESGYR
ncbi:hypothetical protein MKW98_027041 [Papaver atlanticum]|uniref:Uncharacterized protein n=1 Tax=Papaver atlanticum TaxID=357466 RepID=A0AAD4RWU9_9MAGN|nr:hypothetical protein MKW98_027041 [Papaver atlanticum]